MGSGHTRGVDVERMLHELAERWDVPALLEASSV
jgi:hypothetical protein